MKQKAHAQQQHHHHHPVLAEPCPPLGSPSSGAGDDGVGDVDRSLRSPPAIGVHFAAPEEDHGEESHKNEGPRRQVQTTSPSRRRTTAVAAMSASAGEEGTQNGPGGPTVAREQQQQPQTAPFSRASGSREASGASRRRPRSGALPQRGVSVTKSPPAPLGGGSRGPLGGYVIQQGGSCRDAGDSAGGLLGGGAMASGGRGAGGHGGPQVRGVV